MDRDQDAFDVVILGGGPAGENVADRVVRLWHAVPAFPTVSEVWLRLLETYGL